MITITMIIVNVIPGDGDKLSAAGRNTPKTCQ